MVHNFKWLFLKGQVKSTILRATAGAPLAALILCFATYVFILLTSAFVRGRTSMQHSPQDEHMPFCVRSSPSSTESLFNRSVKVSVLPRATHPLCYICFKLYHFSFSHCNKCNYEVGSQCYKDSRPDRISNR